MTHAPSRPSNRISLSVVSKFNFLTLSTLKTFFFNETDLIFTSKDCAFKEVLYNCFTSSVMNKILLWFSIFFVCLKTTSRHNVELPHSAASFLAPHKTTVWNLKITFGGLAISHEFRYINIHKVIFFDSTRSVF